MTKVPPLSAVDLTSLDERLGVLLALRVGLVAAVLAVAAGMPGELASRPAPAVAVSLGYLGIAAVAELVARVRSSLRVPLHRLLLPADVLWLAWVLVPAGGAIRPTVLLLALELVGVTLLASVRNGIRVVLWETAVLLAARLPWLASRLAAARPVAAARATTAETVLAVGGLWALVVCVGWFSAVNERELRRSKRELAALTAMAAELEARPVDDEILGSLLDALHDAFTLDQILAVWDDGERVEVRKRAGRVSRRGPGADDHGAGDTAAGDPGCPQLEPGWEDDATRELWSTRSPVVLAGGTDGVVADLLPGARRVVALPLGPDEGHRGVVAVALPRGRLPRRTVAALRQFSTLATLALRNARLLAERERLAMLDGLTGLANRRSLDRTLTAEVERARRSGEQLSVVVCDIDHFKRVNDTRGHQGGDEVLRVVARILAGSVRASDTAARYGGEEFALVLPSCGTGGARRVAEAVRSAVSSSAELGGLTLSAGVATLDPGAGDAGALVAAADAALYRSKREGRNRVTVAERVGDPPALTEVGGADPSLPVGSVPSRPEGTVPSRREGTVPPRPEGVVDLRHSVGAPGTGTD